MKYFNNVAIFGDLYLKEILINFECTPILSVLYNQTERFLCLCSEIRGKEKYYVVPITDLDLENLKNKRVDILSVFLKEAEIVAIERKIDETEFSYVVKTADLSLEELPKAEVKLP